MSELWGHLTGVIIVVIMVMFICIWAWAWSGYHRRAFSRMAALPMEDDPSPGAADSTPSSPAKDAGA
ncbi:CcoQ/FixQ family Cbb3-type cytochrome c oxidase assembly chaperone [Dyella telluris]|uniref:CcoQ/FixQ family Cbb3-type cytochrome c oxidase assembly chaperone n=1 Tax=Dyella telluris TaxID=2763498 RepID=A0A7G8Q339_9GAMM|nr:CcoQ/FixQ family Cbb3-type cytochrome c oxidase assembly chaperone [Dyella telluris]QNK01197.1 CcoQ/FixQ family Cbb3-type cytochrome c oxidase assembly chaperone [Dyella telluris]